MEESSKNGWIIIAIVVIAIICFCSYLSKVDNADDRAQELVSEYCRSHIYSVEDITYTSIAGSANDDGYFQNEFVMFGTITIEGKTHELYASVVNHTVNKDGYVYLLKIDGSDITKIIEENPSYVLKYE